MSRADYMIIGGSGVGSRLEALSGTRVCIPVEGGLVHGRELLWGGVRVVAVQRHSAGHKLPPHKVNYGAFARAAKVLGVKGTIATAAVGSLVPEWVPGTVVVCSDFLDGSGRQITLYDRTVSHRDFSDPFDPGLRKQLCAAAEKCGCKVEPEGVYLMLNGPRYETPTEIKMVRSWGADVIGMTASSEAIVMREAGIPYACLAVVTNLAAGISETPLDHSEVLDVMNERGEDVLELLQIAVQQQ